MPVQIHINGENADEALRELSSLASGLSPQQGAAAPVDAPKSNSRSRTTAKPVETPAPNENAAPKKEPVGEEDGDSAGGSGDDAGDGAPEPTVVELRAKAQEIAKTPEGKAAIKSLLTGRAISNIPDGDRAAFMKELEALGGKKIEISDDEFMG